MKQANIGHLANNRPLNLIQTQERIDSMRKNKIAMANIEKIKPVALDWKPNGGN